MKSAYSLEGLLGDEYRSILEADKREIDNPEPLHPSRLLYLDRIRMVINQIRKRFPEPAGITVADLACAQANTSLLLAEAGYEVTAVDLNKLFLEYSKKKYERGRIRWIYGNIEEASIPEGSFHAVVLTEIIEHCAFPERIVRRALELLRPDGILVITTPNGARIGNRLPVFSEVASKDAREELAVRQFGPDAEDHLFLFTIQEIKRILPEEANIIEQGYAGSTILLNKFSWKLIKGLPANFVSKFIRFLSKVPVLNRKTFNNIYSVIKKNS